MTGAGETSKKNRILALKIATIAAGMFVFAVGVLPPMYEVFCEITGLNGKTSNEAASTEGVTEQKERVVTIQFLADVDGNVPWDFKPREFTVQVHPGQVMKMDYLAKNVSGEMVVGQAVPSVSPVEATQHFKKTQCFCFDKQPLQAGEEKEMPVIFYVDPALPDHVRTITLSYKLYKFTDSVAAIDGR